MKFRKKPVVIKAEQFDSHDLDQHERLGIFHIDNQGWWIPTLEGEHRVSLGDWIITGIKGERYPCKPDIFEATYDAVPLGQDKD